MSYMKEKYTEVQEQLYESYTKLLEASSIAKEIELFDSEFALKEELKGYFNAMKFAIWWLEHSELYTNFGLDIMHEETVTKNESETKAEGA